MLAVDDERPALEDLAQMLRKRSRGRRRRADTGGGEALRVLADQQFDAVFLDVRMPGLDGLELAAVLGRFASPPLVVFVSAYEDGAVGAFELDIHAVDYLMKPVSKAADRAGARRVVAGGGAGGGAASGGRLREPARPRGGSLDDGRGCRRG